MSDNPTAAPCDQCNQPADSCLCTRTVDLSSAYGLTIKERLELTIQNLRLRVASQAEQIREKRQCERCGIDGKLRVCDECHCELQEKLKTANFVLEKCFEVERQISEKDVEIERLRKALQHYADAEKWTTWLGNLSHEHPRVFDGEEPGYAVAQRALEVGVIK